jgi:hypothetical protein
MGYPIEGVSDQPVGGGEPSEQPAAFYLASANPQAGSEVFKKCTACHIAAKGGPNGTGPNLWGVVGSGIAKRPDGYSAITMVSTLWEHGPQMLERMNQRKLAWPRFTSQQMSDLIALTTKPSRPYRTRYAGIFRQIARNNGLHPIRDRALIQSLMLRVITQAKAVKRQCPRVKYRNIEITDSGVTGYWTTAGPTM